MSYAAKLDIVDYKQLFHQRSSYYVVLQDSIVMPGNCIIDHSIDLIFNKWQLKTDEFDISSTMEVDIRNLMREELYRKRICRMYLNYHSLSSLPNELIRVIDIFLAGSLKIKVIHKSVWHSMQVNYYQLWKKQSKLKEMNREELIQHAHNLEMVLYEQESITYGLRKSQDIINDYLSSDGRDILFQFFKIKRKEYQRLPCRLKYFMN